MLRILLGIFISTQCFAGTPNFKKVIHIIFENADYDEALKAPYFNSLVKYGALFTQFTAITHPSQPNYIAMVAGSPLGVLLDGEYNLNSNHLGTLLSRKGLTWKAYAEGYPGNCYLGKRSGKYVRKHVPFLSFIDVQNNPSECAKVVNANQFYADAQTGSLPAYSMFVPDLNHDGHDTDANQASSWFASAFGTILADQKIMSETLFVITYDETESYFGTNRVFTLLIGANVKAGTVVNTPVNHYSILRLVEDQFGLGNLGLYDSRATPIPDIWQ